MGVYLNTDTVIGPMDKAKDLIENHGAIIIDQPVTLPSESAVVCVVSNGGFDAAALCYSQTELVEFTEPNDLRPKIWLSMSKATAHHLSGYEEKNR